MKTICYCFFDRNPYSENNFAIYLILPLETFDTAKGTNITVHASFDFPKKLKSSIRDIIMRQMKETNNAKMQQIQSSRKQGQPVLSHIDSLQNQHLFLINELQSSQ